MSDLDVERYRSRDPSIAELTKIKGSKRNGEGGTLPNV